MKTGSVKDEIVKEYLRRLEREARRLPSPERAEILADVGAHITEAVAETDGSEESVRGVLAALGTPESIVAAAQPDGSATTFGPRERWAIVLLLIGGLVVPILGWVVGVVLIWSSPAWPIGKKVLATLVWPGGIAVPLVGAAWLIGSTSPVIGLGGVAIGLAAPIAVAVHLVRTARPISTR